MYVMISVVANGAYILCGFKSKNGFGNKETTVQERQDGLLRVCSNSKEVSQRMQEYFQRVLRDRQVLWMRVTEWSHWLEWRERKEKTKPSWGEKKVHLLMGLEDCSRLTLRRGLSFPQRMLPYFRSITWAAEEDPGPQIILWKPYPFQHWWHFSLCSPEVKIMASSC